MQLLGVSRLGPPPKKINFLSSGTVIPEVKTCFLEGIRLVSVFGESRDLGFSRIRSNLGLVSSRLGQPVANREIYNLSMVSGPVLLKIKGKRWIFTFVWIKKMKKTEQWDDIG